MQAFQGKTANDVWMEAARVFASRSGTDVHTGRGGPTLEILQAILVVEEPTERWIVCREPAINPAFCLAEVVWIFTGRQDSGFLNFWNPKLPQFAGVGPTYYGAYGHRLRNRYKIDQIERAYQALRAKPSSRQVVLLIWDPRTDLPSEDGSPRAKDIPCNVSSLLKVRDGRLYWTQIMRSNDLMLGLPHNIVQFTFLQELMASWLEIEPGPYTHLSDSLHVYRDYESTLQGVADLKPDVNNDRWALTFDGTSRVFAILSERMDSMRSATEEGVLREAAIDTNLPQAAQNLLSIVGADVARRQEWEGVKNDLVARCTNPALRQVWSRWETRC